MKRTLLFLILCFVVIFMAGCSHRKAYPEAMQQAVAVMNQYPDSARRLLAPLESTLRQEPEETRIYYRLLTVKADYKCYIVEKSDSAIRAVVNYYERHADPAKLTEAYYYQGCVNKDLGDAPKALHAFQQAASTGADGKNYYLLGRIYNEMGMLYAYQDLPQEALKAQRRALKYIKLAGDTLNIPYILRDIGRAYSKMAISDSSFTDSAIVCYEKGLRMAKRIRNKERERFILTEIIYLYTTKGRLKDAHNALLSTNFGQTNEDNRNVSDITCGDYYRDVGQLDSSAYYYKHSLRYNVIKTRFGAFLGLSQIEKQRGHYKEAMMYADSAQHYWEKSSAQTNAEAMARMTAVYNYQQTMNRNAKLEEANLRGDVRSILLWAALVVVASVGVALFLYTKKRSAEQRERAVKQLHAAEERYRRSEAYVEENEKEIASLETQLATSAQERELMEMEIEKYKALNRQQEALRELKRLADRSFSRNPVCQRFYQAARDKTVCLDKSDWTALQKELDTAYTGFTGQLYAALSTIKNQEIRLCCLLKIKMTNKDMAVLLGRTPSAITRARENLAHKMFGIADGSYLDDFVENA
jgi:tetratricopeptide (TPR) repeat protein